MKKWYQSMTIWLGLLGTAVGIFQQISANPWITANAPIIGTIYSALLIVQRYASLLAQDKKG